MLISDSPVFAINSFNFIVFGLKTNEVLSIINGFATSLPSYLKLVNVKEPAFLMFSYFLFSMEFISKEVETSAFKIPDNLVSKEIGYTFAMLSKLIIPFAFN